jgi:hypothetical protein
VESELGVKDRASARRYGFTGFRGSLSKFACAEISFHTMLVHSFFHTFLVWMPLFTGRTSLIWQAVWRGARGFFVSRDGRVVEPNSRAGVEGLAKQPATTWASPRASNVRTRLNNEVTGRSVSVSQSHGGGRTHGTSAVRAWIERGSSVGRAIVHVPPERVWDQGGAMHATRDAGAAWRHSTHKQCAPLVGSRARVEQVGGGR